jgi:hypothetical protein
MYEYDATIIEVIDADTFSASVDLGFYTYCRQHFRLLDYYAPEIRGVHASLGSSEKRSLRSI